MSRVVALLLKDVVLARWLPAAGMAELLESVRGCGYRLCLRSAA